MVNISSATRARARNRPRILRGALVVLLVVCICFGTFVGTFLHGKVDRGSAEEHPKDPISDIVISRAERTDSLAYHGKKDAVAQDDTHAPLLLCSET